MSETGEVLNCPTCGRTMQRDYKRGGFVCAGCAWNRFMGSDPARGYGTESRHQPTDDHD